jgi:cell division protein FtsL
VSAPATARPARARIPAPHTALPDFGQRTLNERLVRERDRERARDLVRKLGLGVVILLPLLLYLWGHVAFMETARRVAGLREQETQLERLLREVRLERAALESLDRIATHASASLGMAPPAPESVLLVGPDGRAVALPPPPTAGEGQ